MENPIITNEELARRFVDVMSRTSISISALRIARSQIQRCPGAIAEAYAKAGTLAQFHIPYLAHKYYSVIERILSQGVEATGAQVVKEDIAHQKAGAFRGVPGSSSAHVHPESTSAGWENSTRAREDA